MNKNLVMGFAASQMGAMVIVGLLAGSWADKRFGTMPLLTIFGLLGGFGSGIWILVRMIRMRKDS